MFFTINHIYCDTAEHIRSADSDGSEAGIHWKSGEPDVNFRVPSMERTSKLDFHFCEFVA